MYLFNDAKDIFQEKFLENVMDDDNNMDENVEKVLLLGTELLENDKINETMIKLLIKRMNNYL